MPTLDGASVGDLDDDALDHAGQPRASPTAPTSTTRWSRSTAVGEGSRAQVGEKLVLSPRRWSAPSPRPPSSRAHRSWPTSRRRDLDGLVARHPLRGQGYDFDVPLLAGDFVTADAGTGFVHIAPGHGADDYELGRRNGVEVPRHGRRRTAPIYPHVPLFAGKRVYRPNGKTGDANEAVIERDRGGRRAAGARHARPFLSAFLALQGAADLPQHAAMVHRAWTTNELREKALAAIDETRWVPPQATTASRSMIERRPDWCVSRQRAWGVPIAVFVDKKTGEPLRDQAVIDRIAEAFEREGADVWFTPARSASSATSYEADDYEQVTDILDVWFDSGSTHAFVLEKRPELQMAGRALSRRLRPASRLVPFLAARELRHARPRALRRRADARLRARRAGPQDVEVAGQRHRAAGRRATSSGADILRLWVVGTDYTEDLRIGPEILKHQAEAYRRLRNTLRYLLGASPASAAASGRARARCRSSSAGCCIAWPSSTRLVRQAVEDFDFHTMFTALHNFCAVDLSAFYFDIRKDALYCDAPDAPRRRAARTVMDRRLRLPRRAGSRRSSASPPRRPGWRAMATRAETQRASRDSIAEVPAAWRDEALGENWERVRELRRVVTGALELERAAEAHRLEPAGRGDVHAAPGLCRRARRARSRRDLHHLGRRR